MSAQTLLAATSLNTAIQRISSRVSRSAQTTATLSCRSAIWPPATTTSVPSRRTRTAFSANTTARRTPCTRTPPASEPLSSESAITFGAERFQVVFQSLQERGRVQPVLDDLRARPGRHAFELVEVRRRRPDELD